MFEDFVSKFCDQRIKWASLPNLRMFKNIFANSQVSRAAYKSFAISNLQRMIKWT